MKDFALLSRLEQHAFPGARITYTEPPNIANTDTVLMTTNDVSWIAGIFAPGAADNHNCIIYFYGERDNVRNSEVFIQNLRRAGPSVVVFDYRGYGASQGQPSETNFYADAAVIMQWLKDQHPNLRPVVCGKSLGSAVAAHIAATHAVHGLILLAPITNMVDVVKHIFPPDEVIIEEAIPFRFDCLSNIAEVKCPIFITHRDQDVTVPYSMSQALQDSALAPVTWLDLQIGENDHLSGPEGAVLSAALREFLDSL